MRLARFDEDRLGLVEGDAVYDVTAALAGLPALRWPFPPGDQLIANLAGLDDALREARAGATAVPLKDVTLRSPVANPSKIIAAPANYRAHIEIDAADPNVDVTGVRAALLAMDRPVDKLGLFLKSSTSLAGAGDGITIDWPGPERRCDHEVEVAVVIGRTARHVSRADALDYVAGYAIGLDITIRGPEDRSFRKSADSFSVLGPWLATPDEIGDLFDTEFWITVNDEPRQRSSTRAITVDIPELIELASSVYTLYPGDIIMTGTPEGVGPIAPGDVVRAGCDGIGEMLLKVNPLGR
jgi:2,4-didehydro-3-deoxy-L-rhamnonate hydrolase